MRTGMRVVLVAVLCAACGKSAQTGDKSASGGKKADAPAAPTKPLEVKWTKDYADQKGEITGGGTIKVGGFHGQYHISIDDLPDHAGKWKLGAQSGELSSVYTLLDVPITDKLAELTWDGLKSVDPKAELELELLDGRAGKVALPPVDVTYTVEEALKEAEHAPVLFGTEPDDPKKNDSLFWPDALDKKHIGKSGKLYELDWVLIVTKLDEEKGTKVCGGYTDNAGKKAPDITLVFKETEAVIYDRRTGDVVDKKVFPPDKSCPMFTFKAAGEDHEDSSTPYEKIEAWAKTKVKR